MKKYRKTDNIENMEIKLPVVLRARGFRLYTESGKRLVDLWLNGGAAILGHTPANMLREIKNTISRGLYAPYGHFTEDRFLKAMSKIFPGFSFRIYAAPPEELVALFKSGFVKIWRPYINPENPFVINDSPETEGSLYVPVLPGIHTWRADGSNLPFGLCVVAAQSAFAETEKMLKQLPQSDNLSPVLFAAATRGIYDIFRTPQRAKPKLSRIEKVLRLQQSCWERKGIYLTLKKAPNSAEWTNLYFRFLEAGFLLPPIADHPLILPGELSAGEEVKLAVMLERSELV